jgi:hypothetical protein
MSSQIQRLVVVAFDPKVSCECWLVDESYV